MNDDELMTIVKESFTRMHTATPVDQILRRGHAVRVRRRLPILTGAVAAAAGAALAVTTLLPHGHQPSPPPSAQLAAWTVTKQADGTIRVTIREMNDPAGLQAELRADGVPASITLTGQENPSCRPYPADRALLRTIVTPAHESVPPPSASPWPPGSNPEMSPIVVLVIHPSALPSGAGIQLAASFAQSSPGQAHEHVQVDLVDASPQCTGT